MVKQQRGCHNHNLSTEPVPDRGTAITTPSCVAPPSSFSPPRINHQPTHGPCLHPPHFFMLAFSSHPCGNLLLTHCHHLAPLHAVPSTVSRPFPKLSQSSVSIDLHKSPVPTQSSHFHNSFFKAKCYIYT
jgi:hypothetical protein